MSTQKKINKTRNIIKNSIKNGRIINYYNILEIDEKLIFLESRNSSDIAGNIFYIIKELSKKEYSDYTVILSLKEDLFESKKRLLEEYDIHNVEFVVLGSLDYYKYLFSAKFLFNDATFPATFIKKEGQVYLNTWHGTPLKNLGKSNKNRGYGLGNVQRNLL